MKYTIIDRFIPFVAPAFIDLRDVPLFTSVEDYDQDTDNFFNNGSQLKYIKFENNTNGIFIVLFTSLSTHSDVLSMLWNLDRSTVALSAGFTNLKTCYGDSFSLSIKADEEDTEILLKQLNDKGK